MEIVIKIIKLIVMMKSKEIVKITVIIDTNKTKNINNYHNK